MNIDYNKIKGRLETILKDNQTELVTMLLEEKPELYDGMENLYEVSYMIPGEEICARCQKEMERWPEEKKKEFCRNCVESESLPKIVYQWWAIDEHWAKNFSKKGLVVLRAFGCCWLGRTWCGQAVEADDDFQFLGKEEAHNG